ncbi:hypothetical protein P171DRAFT_512373 [Karstenula rhodostoma CBS 690.94]|uniref:Uncharacterized protein n=1 Tax=Karstenula rhodostoma CBS 690.94 TaxID=1392251 RepID=A0A9P4PNQ5_9PLEO|nr:hypothetical protein P171DRAFT_512373 [Karstenula rhodostoma CBS 690.94]
MELRGILFQIIRSISLVSWYLDSPHVARLGRHLANCPHNSLACLEAGQHALRTYQQNRAGWAECYRQQKLEEGRELRMRELKNDPYFNELFRNATEWKARGGTVPVVFNYFDNTTIIEFNNFCPNDMSPSLLLQKLKQDCDKLYGLSDLQLDAATKALLLADAQAEVSSLKGIPPVLSIDAPLLFSNHYERFVLFLARSGIDIDGIRGYSTRHPETFLLSTAVFVIGVFCIIRFLLWCLYKLFRFCKPSKVLQSNERAWSDQPNRRNKPAQDHRAQFQIPSPVRRPIQADQPLRRHQPETALSPRPKQAPRPSQPTHSEASDTVPASTTHIETSELEHLRKQASDTGGLTNATNLIADAVEGKSRKQGHPVRENNRDMVKRIQRNIGNEPDKEKNKEDEDDDEELWKDEEEKL